MIRQGLWRGFRTGAMDIAVREFWLLNGAGANQQILPKHGKQASHDRIRAKVNWLAKIGKT